jgi:hypothetical protein
VQHLGARLGVRKRSVVGPDGRPKVLGERLQPDVRHIGPHHAARESCGANGRRLQRLVRQPLQRDVQEREVEARIVRDEHAAVGEFRERGDDRVDRGCARNGGVVDAGEVRDLARDRYAGVHQRLERADALAPAELESADLGDAALDRRAAGRLEIHDDERDLGERNGIVENTLDGLERHRVPPGGPREGASGYPNTCSSVKTRAAAPV